MLKLLQGALAFAIICAMAGSSAHAAEPAEALAKCDSLPEGRKARIAKDGSSYMLAATLLEDQGKGATRPDFAAPESLCAAESFAVGAMQVDAIFAGFTKGMQTLVYHFDAKSSDDAREILVTYSGMLSFIKGKGSYFPVTESSGDAVNIYAIYESEPPYLQVKTLVEGVLSGKQKPLLSAHWEEGEDELIITVYDSKRLR